MLRVTVEVTPRAGRAGVIGRRGDALKVKVTSPPVGGRANDDLVTLVARFFGVPRSRVRIARGGAGRRKILEVDGLTEAKVRDALASLAEVGR